jgi:WD40 repeat protein
MAESSPKRQKIEMESGESSRRLAVGKSIDTILNIDFEEFKSQVSNMDFDSYKKLTDCLSKLGQAMKESRASFSDIPASAVASNMFHYLENRTDWDNFALVTKEINKAVTEHKDITPPWPEGQLNHTSIDNSSRPKFSHDGEFIAYGNRRGDICLASRRKGQVASWRGHERCLSVSFSPCSNLLVSISNDHTIKLWDLDNHNLCLWTQEDNSQHDTVVFSPTGDVFATFRRDGYEPVVVLRNTSDGAISQTFASEVIQKTNVTLSPDGRTLAVCGTQNAIELWDLDDSGSTATLLDGHAGCMLDIAYSPDGKFLASASNDKTIKIRDTSNWRCVQTLKGHTGPVRFLSLSPDGKFLASVGVGDDRNIRVWCLANGNCVETVNVSILVNSVEFSKDGKMLLTKEPGDGRAQHVMRLRYVHLGLGQA